MEKGNPNYLLFMGVAGAGKSSVGGEVARRLGLGFIEADDHHSAENKARLARGDALSDDMRHPWLDAVAAAARERREAGGLPVVIACSALKRSYRDRLRAALPRLFVFHLRTEASEIAKRLVARQNHFAGPELLGSQLAILEPLQADEWGADLDNSPAPGVVIADAERLSRTLIGEVGWLGNADRDQA